MDPAEEAPRKRVTRACDKCSTLRTRCDGSLPCRRCREYQNRCSYDRRAKKRGRIPSSLAAQLRPVRDRHHAASAPYTLDTTFESLTPSLPELAEPSYRHDVNQTTPTGPQPYAPSADWPPAERTSSFSFACSGQLTAADTSVLENAHPECGSDGFDAVPQQASPRTTTEQEVATTHNHRALLSTNAEGEGHDAANCTLPRRITPSVITSEGPTDACRYRFLHPVLPYVQHALPASLACDLLDVFLTDAGSSIFRYASPYILTRVFRKKSITDPVAPRPTSPALLAAILWCTAQTADCTSLRLPGARARLVDALYRCTTSLILERDPDHRQRVRGSTTAQSDELSEGWSSEESPRTWSTHAVPPTAAVDDVLTYILLTVSVSGGEFKTDCHKWWSKAIQLMFQLDLHREADRSYAHTVTNTDVCIFYPHLQHNSFLSNEEAREERRRVFWLLYGLDRHLSLSFNTNVTILDSYCDVYSPLPERTWEDLDRLSTSDLPVRCSGPPLTVTGAGFFEFFLPLMAILGDIIELHHGKQHPRLGTVCCTKSVQIVSDQLSYCMRSVRNLIPSADRAGVRDLREPTIDASDATNSPSPNSYGTISSRRQLVAAYSTHIIHVLYVLLYGKWDAISMLDDGDEWITSDSFSICSHHAIAASEAVAQLLALDPELTFMPYLLGIYLLHGSFVILLFADRMPQLGPNQSVEQACETIIRAHEVCVVTLSTEFQIQFRKLLRATLYKVQSSEASEGELFKVQRTALSLYRWIKGGKGLGL